MSALVETHVRQMKKKSLAKKTKIRLGDICVILRPKHSLEGIGCYSKDDGFQDMFLITKELGNNIETLSLVSGVERTLTKESLLSAGGGVEISDHVDLHPDMRKWPTELTKQLGGKFDPSNKLMKLLHISMAGVDRVKKITSSKKRRNRRRTLGSKGEPNYKGLRLSAGVLRTILRIGQTPQGNKVSVLEVIPSKSCLRGYFNEFLPHGCPIVVCTKELSNIIKMREDNSVFLQNVDSGYFGEDLDRYIEKGFLLVIPKVVLETAIIAYPKSLYPHSYVGANSNEKKTLLVSNYIESTESDHIDIDLMEETPQEDHYDEYDYPEPDLL